MVFSELAPLLPGHALDVDIDARTAAESAHRVEIGSAEDGGDPSVEFGVWLVLNCMGKCPHDRRLHQVVGHRAVSGRASRKAIDVRKAVEHVFVHHCAHREGFMCAIWSDENCFDAFRIVQALWHFSDLPGV